MFRKRKLWRGMSFSFWVGLGAGSICISIRLYGLYDLLFFLPMTKKDILMAKYQLIT